MSGCRITVGNNVVLVKPDQVVIEVSGGENVHIGGTAGQALATAMFISGNFNPHFHSAPRPDQAARL